MRSTLPGSKPSWAGGRRRISTPGSRRRSAGISKTTGGGARCGSVIPASGLGSSSPPRADAVRMLVTGQEGQVARSLAERAPAGAIELVALGRPELDLAGAPEAIVAATKAARPDIIVSAAAYTAVDRAESESELAFAVNEQGPKAIADA